MATISIFGRQIAPPVLVAFLFAFLDTICLFVNALLLPYVTKSLNVTSNQFGYMQSVSGIILLIGGLLYGQICDMVGMRKGFLIVLAAATTCYASVGIAGGFTALLISRIVCIFFQGVQANQTIIAKSTTGSERSATFAQLGAFGCIGSIIGPFIGGIASTYLNPQTVYILMAVAYLSLVPLVIKCIPEEPVDPSVVRKFDPGAYLKVLQTPLIKPLIAIKCLSAAPFFLIDTVLNLYLIEKFGLSAAKTSRLGISNGIVMAFVTIAAIPKMKRNFSDVTIAFIGCASMVFGFFAIRLFSEFWHLFFIMPLILIGMTMIGIMADSEMTRSVSQGDTGKMLGVANSAVALCMTVAPMISANLLKSHGFTMFGIIGITLTVVNCAVIYSLVGLSKRVEEKHED